MVDTNPSTYAQALDGAYTEGFKSLPSPSTLCPLGPLVITEDGSYTVQDLSTGECYHSRKGARREAEELYINVSGFCDSLEHHPSPTLTVLDVGLGLGYNAAATLEAWLRASHPPNVHMVSLENNPEVIQSLLNPKAPWTADWNPRVQDALSGMKQIAPNHWASSLVGSKNLDDSLNSYRLTPSPGPVFLWEIFLLDAAHDPLPYHGCPGPSLLESELDASGSGQNLSSKSPLRWDYVWQDPFSPQRNPEMWSSAWFSKVREQCLPGTKILTYSVARRVREALEESGFTWEKRRPPFLMKKHWLLASPRLDQT